MLDILISGSLSEPPAEPPAELSAMPAKTYFSKLIGILRDPDALAGWTTSELHRAVILVAVLGCRLHQILMICDARYGCRKYGRHETAIA